MNTRIAILLLVLAAAVSTPVQATPLNDLREPVSKLEFGSFKLETALAGIRDWPFPIEGAGVSARIEPDQLEIVIAVSKVPAESFRNACSLTLRRVREFLYVDADGHAPMGRSHLSAYFRGSWLASRREAALRELDAATQIRVDVIKRGSCRAALIKAPITFDSTSTK